MDTAAPPAWFVDAIDVVPESRVIDVDGIPVHYLRWGPVGVPGIVLVHGAAAHAHWWSHIAPLLLDGYAVAALDLSGHGDSGRRDTYGMPTWAAEVLAVADDAQFVSPPVLVGHSMGGFVTIATAATAGRRVGGIIIIDSPVIDADPEVKAAARGAEFGNPKVYEDRAAAIARFRTVPAQENYLPWVMANVARHSLCEVEGGVTWKFDPRVFASIDRTASYLPSVQCRVALLRAEHGLVTTEIGAHMYEQLGRVAPVIELPTAGHHPMLDVPLILITAIRSLLADWDHSTPHERT